MPADLLVVRARISPSRRSRACSYSEYLFKFLLGIIWGSLGVNNNGKKGGRERALSWGQKTGYYFYYYLEKEGRECVFSTYRTMLVSDMNCSQTCLARQARPNLLVQCLNPLIEELYVVKKRWSDFNDLQYWKFRSGISSSWVEKISTADLISSSSGRRGVRNIFCFGVIFR